MSRAVITPASVPLSGTPQLPGDKSISHRRALLSLLINEDVVLTHFNAGADCAATLDCLERLGKQVIRNSERVIIRGETDWHSGELDCGNSGTTVRLLMGMLATREGEWVLRGDASLSRRPMERVAEPLRRMGAEIATTDGRLPVRIRGRKLRGIEYESPVSSAQVKTAVLLAAMQATGTTRYREPVLSRDHTERILGLKPDREGWLTVDPTDVSITADTLSATIPADPSAAAFWIGAALLVPGSAIAADDILANPTRIAYIKLLREAGANILSDECRTEFGEDVAQIRVTHSTISSLKISQADAAALIDEFPILAVIAAKNNGESEFTGIGELRVKESDRLAVMAEGLTRMGCRVDLRYDGMTITGAECLRGADIETQGDHRIAMAMAMAGLAAEGKTVIDQAECVTISDPGFWNELARFCPGCVEVTDG
ncbi:MAG: 3-phosphoshikimate 1-carboxyvinyltransferase [Calditrichota bacterium]